MDCVRETTHRSREHQTTGKRVGTKKNIRSHATTMTIPEQSSTQRRQQNSGPVQSRNTRPRHHTTGGETQRFTEQTTQVPRKSHGKTGTHTNITTQHSSMQCWASLKKLYLDEAENRIKGTRTFWIGIYKGASALANQ
jgi:hypothetical protein